MKRILSSCLLIILPFLLCRGQNLSGSVKDSATAEPIIGAAIKVDGGKGTVSDVNGDFKLNLSPGIRTLDISFVGYHSKKVTLEIKDSVPYTLEIVLSDAAEQLDIVVISAGKFEQKLEEVTVSMEVLKPDLIENKNTNNMESIIDQVPGVNVMDGQINIRGGGGFSYGAGSRVMLLVDDLPCLSADAGDIKWNFLPVENIEQVEIIKGASSALFGSSALNGVLNIRTAYPTDVPKTSISLSSGMYFDPQRSELKWWGNNNPIYSASNFFHSRQIKQLDLVIAGQLFSDEGYRELEKEQRYRLNANLRWRSKKHEGISYGVNFNRMKTEGGLFILWAGADSAYKPSGGELQLYSNHRTSIDPFFTWLTKKDSRHSVRSRFFQTDNQNDTEQGSVAELFYGEYQYQKNFKKDLTLCAGITGNYSEIHSDSIYGDHYQSNVGLFAQLDKKYKKFTFSLGVRGEFFKVDTAQTEFNIVLGKDTIVSRLYPVFRGGVNWHACEHTYLRASYGQGYRFPAVAEKYVKTTAGGLTIFPNHELQPETGWSAELGLKQGLKFKKWLGYADVALFWTEYKNMMEFNVGYHIPDSIANPGLLDYFTYFGAKSLNVGHARITGVETSITGKGKIAKDLDMTILAGYTFIEPVNLSKDSTYTKTFSDSGSTFLKYRFRHVAKMDVQLDYKKWSFGISVRYNSFMENIDKSFEMELFNDILPTYHSGLYILPGLKEYRQEHTKGDIVFDARLAYQLTKNAKVNFLLNNVFNREYMSRPGDMQPPVNGAIQVMIKF